MFLLSEKFKSSKRILIDWARFEIYYITYSQWENQFLQRRARNRKITADIEANANSYKQIKTFEPFAKVEKCFPINFPLFSFCASLFILLRTRQLENRDGARKVRCVRICTVCESRLYAMNYSYNEFNLTTTDVDDIIQRLFNNEVGILNFPLCLLYGLSIFGIWNVLCRKFETQCQKLPRTELKVHIGLFYIIKAKFPESNNCRRKAYVCKLLDVFDMNSYD